MVDFDGFRPKTPILDFGGFEKGSKRNSSGRVVLSFDSKSARDPINRKGPKSVKKGFVMAQAVISCRPEGRFLNCGCESAKVEFLIKKWSKLKLNQNGSF